MVGQLNFGDFTNFYIGANTGGVPVGLRRRGRDFPLPTTVKPDASPALGLRTKDPAAVASSPRFHIPTGVPQLELDRFYPYPCAPVPITG